jgi:CheY-like chemotaxis protein
MCHVLIIEDEPLVAMLVRQILEDEGATSFSFADTQANAVAAAISHPPALITSDVKLFAGTGPLAVSAIHEELGPIPVIFITGTPADCHPCNPPGRVLQKPLNQAEFAAAFREISNAASSTRSSTFRPSTASLPSTTKAQSHSSGPPIRIRSSPPSGAGTKC